MAQITYADKVALNENPNINAINKVQDTDMNEIKEVVNENETKILLAVTDTAPANCDTGDMYYNTTDDLIYTATATDTWSSTGVAPTENTLYVVLTTQTSYMYDGNTLISVGGGGSSITVHNSYSASTTEPYSANYVNGAISGAIVSTYTDNQTSAYSTEYINDMMDYSTSEVNTGKKWIDGKPIYRKVLEATNVSGNSTTNINTGVTGIDKVLDYTGWGYDASGDCFLVNKAHKNNFSYQAGFYYNKPNNRFEIETGSSQSYASLYIVFEYTKSS